MDNIKVNQQLCTLCGKCIRVCPFGVIQIKNKTIQIGDDCRLCTKCVKACPNSAITINVALNCTVDKSKWSNILVYIECQEERIHPVAFQLIGKAAELAKTVSFKVYGLMIGNKVTQFSDNLKGYPLERVFVYEHPEFEHFRADIYANAFEDCINTLHPSVILIGGTQLGRSIAPKVATRFHTGLTADCTQLEIKANTDLVQIRPAFGGNIMAQIVTANTRPQFATVRYNVMKPAKPVPGQKVEFIKKMMTPEAFISGIKILSVKSIPKQKEITESKVLVVAGRGLKSKDDIVMLEELAQLLGGQVASTRGLVEKGWMPQEKQIGLSGKAVNPKILIACGVSGSVQFIAGMLNTDNVFAINNDPNAKIFSISHYPICGDLYEIIPKLIHVLKENNK